MGDLFSGGHIILIILVVLLLFGGKKIPELMRGLGRGIREFKDAKDNVKSQIQDHMNTDQPPINTKNDQPTIANNPTQMSIPTAKEDSKVSH